VKAVLRRTPSRELHDPKARLEFSGLVIDPEAHEVLIDGKSAEFTRTEFRLLHLLASHSGRAYTRQVMLDHLVGPEAIVVDRSIDVHVNSIRKKLGRRRDCVKTVRGVGYKFHNSAET